MYLQGFMPEEVQLKNAADLAGVCKMQKVMRPAYAIESSC